MGISEYIALAYSILITLVIIAFATFIWWLGWL